MKANARAERLEREIQWWSDWFELDYTWEGLILHPVRGGGLHGEQTLQDYWRRDPVTGRTRTDAELKEAGELFEFDNRLWHLAHLPLRGEVSGEASWKADIDHPEWARLNDLIIARVSAGGETPGRHLGPDEDGWRPLGVDGRARLDGAVIAWPQARAVETELFVSCMSTWFVGVFVAGRAVVGVGTYFDHAAFSDGADFSGAVFAGDVRFYGALFLDVADFSGARFLGASCFDYALFLARVDFGLVTFSGTASFENGQFFGWADFSGASLSGKGLFLEAVFSGEAQFTNAVVSGEIYFNDVSFDGGAEFRGAKFMDVADFTGASFSGLNTFSYAVFSGDAYFETIAISGISEFYHAKFHASFAMSGECAAMLEFGNAIFQGPVEFGVRIDRPERNFTGAFYAARFGAIADFSGAVGVGEGGWLAIAFGEAVFEKALILTDETAERPEFFKALSARVLEGTADPAETDKRLRGLEAGNRAIKIAMGKARDEQREQRYYRFQIMARLARSDIGAWERALGGAYRLFSDFGSSFSRPLISLAVATLLFGYAYAGWGGSLAEGRLKIWPGRERVFEGQGIALLALKPFAAIEASKPAADAHPTLAAILTFNPAVALGFRVVTTLQAVVSTLLIFLFGLAVKRRFQIS